MKIPNFFLLGSGRCGTTTLYNLLKQHPDIYMTNPKEPSFFCSYFQIVKNPIDYFNLFKNCKNEKMVGEASHVYFSNPESSEVINSLFPDAKFILIFRNPTNRAYSLYNWAKGRKFEKSKTFEEAIKIENDRYKNKNFFKSCPYYFWNFMYIRSSYYDIQWKRYLELYDRSKFFVLNLYEFSNDPYSWISKIYDFLEVDSSFKPKFQHKHKSNCIPMNLKTREKLDKHFKSTIEETEKIAGRKLYLDRL